MFLELHIFSISVNNIYLLMTPKSELSNFQKQNEGYVCFSSHATYLCVQARKFWSHWTVISYHMTVDYDVTQENHYCRREYGREKLVLHAFVFMQMSLENHDLSMIVFK